MKQVLIEPPAPAGGVNSGETPRDRFSRELRERADRKARRIGAIAQPRALERVRRDPRPANEASRRASGAFFADGARLPDEITRRDDKALKGA